MHVWCNAHEAVKVSEVVGYGNVDYVAKATEAATAIENLAVDADNATKLAALKTYMNWRLCFTSYEQANNIESAKVGELKAYLNGLGTQTIVANCYDAIVTDMPDWSGNANKFNPNGKAYSVSLPNIMYGLYDSFSMYLKCNDPGEDFTWTVGNGDNSMVLTRNSGTAWLGFSVSKHDDGKYYMTMQDANSASNIQVQLSDAVVRGDEAFTFTLQTTGWSWCWLGMSDADNVINATVAK